MSRRTLVLLVAVAVLVLLLEGGALAVGAHRGSSGSSGSSPDADTARWSARLHSHGGTEVPSSQLVLDSPCQRLPDGSLRWSGTCVLHVPAAGGFPLRGVSRTLTLSATSGTVHLHSTVRGQDVDGDVTGEGSRLSFGRPGVTVQLQCAGLGACVVRPGR